VFYGPEQAGIHDRAFGKLADFAAEDLLAKLATLATLAPQTGTVVDLGCGSGILARKLTDAGYDTLGIDISPDMVALARANAPAGRFAVGSLYHAELPPGCVAVAATGEALNYGADPTAGREAVESLATRIHAALVPGGWWIFDISGPGRAGPTRTVKQFHRHDDWCLGMTATESEAGDRLDRQITIFAAQADGAYRRIEEHHVLRLYDPAEIISMLGRVGFDAEVLSDYRSAAIELDLPGWHVIEARKRSLQGAG
jgi:SAM-dependent methyltransferase